ncbi:hypothetical protein [Deinococcus sp. 23YEL01]|uniref:hypothetical protein n=1 Tax=Deinococcus sp. 23YEL01 TaxID=2745871 RepID=UPI001E31E035|nr:hypothetical protein [Deinococcus sp. 23YEL01]MCD0170564.1 hypothetical protein [Deinococcus sp. 23YEL01]
MTMIQPARPKPVRKSKTEASGGTSAPSTSPSRRSALPLIQDVQPIHLKFLVVILATCVVLALLGVVLYLTLNGKDATAPIAGIVTTVISGRGLFRLYERAIR